MKFRGFQDLFVGLATCVMSVVDSVYKQKLNILTQNRLLSNNPCNALLYMLSHISNYLPIYDKKYYIHNIIILKYNFNLYLAQSKVHGSYKLGHKCFMQPQSL